MCFRACTPLLPSLLTSFLVYVRTLMQNHHHVKEQETAPILSASTPPVPSLLLALPLNHIRARRQGHCQIKEECGRGVTCVGPFN